MKLSRFLLIVTALLAMNSAFALSKKSNKAEIPQRVISVDYSMENGLINTMFKQCVGAGRANEGLRADWQQQLAFVKNECDFKYIRMHGLLTDDMASTLKTTKEILNITLCILMHYLIIYCR